MQELSRLEQKKGQKYAFLANLLTPSGFYVMLGPLMIIYSGDVLSLTPSRISSILAIIPLISIIRLLFISKLSELGKAKIIVLTSIFQSLLVIIMIVFPTEKITYNLYLILLILYSFIGQLGVGTAWQPLMRDITTNQDRGTFFSRMRLFFTIANLIITGITPLVIGESISSIEYKFFLVLPLLSHLMMIIMVRKIPETIVDKKNSIKLGFGEIVSEIRQLKKPLLVTILVQLTMFPLFVLYLKQVLNLPSNIVTTSIFISTLGNATSLLIWGKISDIIGFKNTIFGVHLLGLLQIPFLLIVKPQLLITSYPILIAGLLIYSFIGGVVGAGSGIATISIQHFFASKERSILVFSIYSAISLILNSVWIQLNGKIIEKFTLQIPLTSFLSDYIYLDGIKIFMITTSILSCFSLFQTVKKLPNIRPWYGLSDFFVSLNPSSMRSLILSSRIHRLNDFGREEISYTFGRKSNPFSIHSLISLLKDPSYDVKISAIRELGRSGSRLAGKNLYELLKNPNLSIYHEHIIWALGQLQWDEASEDIMLLLESDRSEKLKAVACRALGKIGVVEAIPILKKNIQIMTPTFHLSSSACWALINLDMINSAEAIFDALPLYKDNDIRFEIMDILCPHLNISNTWILIYGKDLAGYQALIQFIDDQSQKWRKDKNKTIDALKNGNCDYIKKMHSEFIANSENMIYLALNKALYKHEYWNPLFLLASAQILLSSK